MADKIFEDDEFIEKRFSCGCLWSGHILDVSIELADGGKRVVDCSLSLHMDGKAPLKYRLKQIWRLLRGEEGDLADFVLRTEDVPELIELLSRTVVNPKPESA
jgi:hypothetical protein